VPVTLASVARVGGHHFAEARRDESQLTSVARATSPAGEHVGDEKRIIVRAHITAIGFLTRSLRPSDQPNVHLVYQCCRARRAFRPSRATVPQCLAATLTVAVYRCPVFHTVPIGHGGAGRQARKKRKTETVGTRRETYPNCAPAPFQVSLPEIRVPRHRARRSSPSGQARGLVLS